jgi:hypothetical protein
LRKSVRLPAGIAVHLQPGILFAFTPERFSRSPRNRVHLRPESATAKELAKVAQKWPASRLIEIWNSMPGVSPVRKFTSRQVAIDRIWKAIQGLAPEDRAQATAGATKRARAAKATISDSEARVGSKTATMLQLLRRPGGAALAELMAATEWQAHSVRGFLSGTLRKKMGLKVESAESAAGERRYSIQV